MNGQDDSLGGGSPRMVDKIRNAGQYNANNRLLIDIADSASWSNTDTITDLSFVGGYTMTNGWSGSPGTADMISVGTLGSLTKDTYLQCDSTGTGQTGSQDAIETSTDQSWVINLHKNNGLGSLAGWFWMQNATQTMTFFATSEIFWTNDQGFALAASGGANAAFWNRTGGAQGQILGGADVLPGVWVFVAFGLDEANNDLYVQVDASQTLKADYASTDTGAPDGKLHMGVNSVSHWGNGSGWRINCAFGWDDYVTPTEMLAVYNATKDRFV